MGIHGDIVVYKGIQGYTWVYKGIHGYIGVCVGICGYIYSVHHRKCGARVVCVKNPNERGTSE